MMGLPLDEVRKIKKAFMQDHWKPPMNSCGISKVGIYDKNASANEKDDYCISVGIETPLPSGQTLPAKYHGVKVFVRVVGKIYAA